MPYNNIFFKSADKKFPPHAFLVRFTYIIARGIFCRYQSSLIFPHRLSLGAYKPQFFLLFLYQAQSKCLYFKFYEWRMSLDDGKIFENVILEKINMCLAPVCLDLEKSDFTSKNSWTQFVGVCTGNTFARSQSTASPSLVIRIRLQFQKIFIQIYAQTTTQKHDDRSFNLKKKHIYSFFFFANLNFFMNEKLKMTKKSFIQDFFFK